MYRLNLETHRTQLLSLLDAMDINNLFARAVVNGEANGAVYADDENAPHSFYIVHMYGMSLLCGDPFNDVFNRRFLEHALNSSGKRSSFEWMQAYPKEWHSKLTDLFGKRLIRVEDNAGKQTSGVIELNTRVNFTFNEPVYRKLRLEMNMAAQDIRITTAEIYSAMKGSVVPSAFWNSSDEFEKKAKGFTVMIDEKPASTAFSSFLYKEKLELGIETGPAFRGKGLARYACAALIDFCLEKNLEPVWACRLANTASYRLALHLGFDPEKFLPYYKLGV